MCVMCVCVCVCVCDVCTCMCVCVWYKWYVHVHASIHVYICMSEIEKSLFLHEPIGMHVDSYDHVHTIHRHSCS